MLRVLSLLAAGILLAGSASPQGAARSVVREATPTPTPTPPLVRTPIHTASADEGHEYGIWCGGDGYKASFHGGMTFVPYLGTDSADNLPLAWRTESVAVGDHELLVDHDDPVPLQAEYRFEYHHPGGVVEAYDVLRRGLEQTFVISRLPGDGDLVIRGAITSDLRPAEVAPAHQALTFRDAHGNAVVEYGAGVAYDAAGRRVEVLTGYANGRITLTVPGSWLAAATLPVVVDPLIGPTGISIVNPSGGVTSIDIALDEESVLWTNMILYTRSVSSTDSDLYVYVFDSNYQNSALVYSDLATNWATDSPACAFVGGADRWAIVFRRLFDTGGSRIRAHVHDRGSNAFSTTFSGPSVPTGWNDWRPDLGGVQSFDSGKDAMIVFQAENNTLQGGAFNDTPRSEVHGVVFDPSVGNGSFGSRFTISAGVNSDHERPSVNRVAAGSSGAPYSWICALQVHGALFGPDDWDVHCHRLDNLGNVAGGTFMSDVGTPGTRHQLGPIVEGSDGRYAVCFAAEPVPVQGSKPSGIRAEEIWLDRFDWPDGSSAPTVDLPAQQVAASTLPALEVTGLAFDGKDRSHWCVLWRSIYIAYSGHYAYVGYNGAPTEIGDVHPSSNSFVTPLAATFSYTGNHYRFASTTRLFGGNLFWVTDGVYQSVPVPVTAGPGCSTATIEWDGSQQIGAEFSGVQVTGATPTAGHFLLVSLATTNLPVTVPGVGSGCSLLVDLNNGYLGTLAFQLGERPFWQFSLPEWLDPTSFYFQDWILDGNQFVNTERLEVAVTK